MIKSMTGFGKGEFTDKKRHITVEIRSVNHRYSDINVKMPRRYSFAEDKIKRIVKETVSRGKMEVSIMVENITEDDINVKLNTMVAKQYVDNLTELKKAFSLEGEIDLRLLSSLPDVMRAIPDVEDEEDMGNAIEKALRQALEAFDRMRSTEGNQLMEDLILRGHKIRDFLKQIEERAPMVSKTYADKMKDRIAELIGKDIAVPEERILLEAAIFADKSNITEELVRLDSHMVQLENIIHRSDKADGKKLDFLVQEMNREANTIGSKSNDMQITGVMLEIKSEIEKIREQIQNIE